MGKGITNLTGEKLHESQLLDSVKTVCRAHKVEPTHIHGLANEKTAQYQIYIEGLKTNEIDNQSIKLWKMILIMSFLMNNS